MSSGRLYGLYDKCGVEYEKRSAGKGKVTELPITTVETPKRTQKEVDTFEVKYIKRDIDGKTIQDQITNFVSILNTDSRYEVRLVVTEIL